MSRLTEQSACSSCGSETSRQTWTAEAACTWRNVTCVASVCTAQRRPCKRSMSHVLCHDDQMVAVFLPAQVLRLTSVSSTRTGAGHNTRQPREGQPLHFMYLACQSAFRFVLVLQKQWLVGVSMTLGCVTVNQCMNLLYLPGAWAPLQKWQELGDMSIGGLQIRQSECCPLRCE